MQQLLLEAVDISPPHFLYMHVQTCIIIIEVYICLEIAPSLIFSADINLVSISSVCPPSLRGIFHHYYSPRVSS